MLISHILITKDVIRALDIFPDTKLLKTTLNARVIFKTSFASGQGVSEAEPNGKGASEVMALHNEIKKILKQKLKEDVKKPKKGSIDRDKSYKRIHINNVDDK
jgi:3-deoxy-D-manno-octulosonic acid (KDO) 8-phosphate synthase